MNAGRPDAQPPRGTVTPRVDAHPGSAKDSRMPAIIVRAVPCPVAC